MKLVIDLPEDALALDVQTVTAAIRYIVVAVWPKSRVQVEGVFDPLRS